MMRETRPRPVARVLLVDASGRVLLFRSVLVYGSFWLAPGGGVEPGESFEQAARREVQEETGLRISELGPCVWTTRFTFSYLDHDYDQMERYYLHRLEGLEVRTANWQEEERREIQEYRWWSPAEITASSERFRPLALGVLLNRLLDRPPAESPIDVPA